MDSTNENTQRILSICTGGRMLDMGVERAVGDCQHVAYVEIEAFCCYNLVAQMEKGVVATAPIWTNLKTFDPSPFCGLVDGIVGGYPCQPFSHAGQRRGTDDPRHLWPHIERITNAIQPVWCFFENVEGHLSLGFDEVYRSLDAMGYTVEAGIFSAAELGASQVRERLFILAVSDPRRVWDCVANTHGHGIRAKSKQLGGHPSEFGQVGEDVANTYGKREKYISRGFCTEKSKFRLYCKTKWPAQPGHPQHAWEAPRTAKPGLGCTVDGYNFRRDILRMLGNGVVHPVATHAFLTLFEKQCKNFGLPPIQSLNPSILQSFNPSHD